MAYKLTTQQVQKPILSPSMQQSIEVLLLPLAELQMAVEQELQTNPLLETAEENEPETSQSTEIDNALQKQIERENDRTDFSYASNFSDDEILEDRILQNETTLEDDLLQQLHVEISDPLKIKIGEIIIGNIDEDGFLKITTEEIAKEVNISEAEIIEEVLATIRNFEPVGIASRDLKECLLTQAVTKYNGSHRLVTAVINSFLDDLGHKRYPEIARELSVSPDQIKEAAKLIATLEPRPARNHRHISPAIYIKPDLIVQKDLDGRYTVDTADTGLPSLRINPMYKNMLNQRTLSQEEKEFIREKLKTALQFIKSIEQRGQTIRSIGEYLLKYQKDFFEKGHGGLVPMTLKDVAAVLERNESTISRAISGKYIDTPQGVFPIKFFFSQGLHNHAPGNANVAARSVQEEIKELIEVESKSSPLSDQDIQGYFEKKGMTIARRTINKYRKTMHILPSHLRKT